ncbi:glutamate 5-kinase [Salisediminibacterium halotolerans]|uniref:Glutamate 5-kinase n=1 Tax=Salisediminibacterium halotolerans TaxID=517425 RepID=A0A1H9RQG5_9BACI|nr:MULTISPECIES: glutamate 5-kinase [Salisediminibacterium]RLJ81047.1 glutamate 5-kinase [Actinophytocola xinjiangensis]RPE87863.1 glutamate 5-kinase [Salisediminibacterium halotolerans]TWG37940.1 glutamate 5-kinase [Salisediminibacterium halotolerans]SER75022.1 glutamate 5-kinase [Salisediminibacterium haloalkalitolerans]GEL08823.1 glutamate 5-kinase 1 [Salisediminibacterium halotolerans]
MAKKRIVIKIGSSSLTTNQGKLSEKQMEHVTQMIAASYRDNYEVIVISSGAVSAGFGEMGYPVRPQTLKGKQAAASVGQTVLMRHYQDRLNANGVVSAQLLLTRADFTDEERYHHMFNTFDELFKRGVVPIINENDATAVDELTFGDNDMLASLVSGFIHADQLIIWTDVDGIYNGNPLTDAHAEKIYSLTGLPAELIDGIDNSSSSSVGTGGMKSKLSAADRALSMGVPVFIGNGIHQHAVHDVIAGQGNGTYLYPTTDRPMKTKKQWIAFHSDIKGSLTVDNGAAEALVENYHSLLPVGIISVQGEFIEGDVITVYDSDGNLLGNGKAGISKNELATMIASGSSPASKTRTAIHRDDWITIKEEKKGESL